MYLDDVVSANGRLYKNILHRKNKSLGIINQIMYNLQSTYFGKYYFKVTLVLRSSLLLSSILLNSEAWVNISPQNTRAIEQIYKMLLTRILECDKNTRNAIKYLELGLYPVRFELMKRSILFFQYISQQEKTSMMYQILKATIESPL